MDVLFFLTTLITGIFIGGLAAFGILCMIIRWDDKQQAALARRHAEKNPV